MDDPAWEPVPLCPPFVSLLLEWRQEQAFNPLQLL